MASSFPATNPTAGASSFSTNSKSLIAAIRKLLSSYKVASDGKINFNAWTDSRASSLWLPDHEGIIRETPAGIPALVDPATGRTPRVVRNLILNSSSGVYSDDMTTGWLAANSASIVNATTWTTGATNSFVYATNCLDSIPSNGQVYVCRVKVSVSADCKLRFRIGDLVTSYKNMYAADGEFTFSQTKAFTSAGISKTFGIQCETSGVTITSTEFQIEEVTGVTNQNPSEYVAVNASSDGFAYYATTNGNTVDGNGVVTEAVGSNLSNYGEWGFAHYPGATNELLNNDDLSLWLGTLTVAENGSLQGRKRWELTKSKATTSESLVSNTFTNDLSSTYVARISIWAGTSTNCDVGIYASGWTGNNITKVSGPGTVTLSSLGRITNLDPVTPTIIDIELDSSIAGSSTTKLLIYPDGAGSTTIGAGCIVQVNNLEKAFVTPYIPTAGAPVSRDVCVINHPYAGFFNQDEGVLVFDWVPLHDAYVRSIAQPLFTLNPSTTTGPAYIGTVNLGKFNATDGINYASVIPPTTYVDGDLARVATRWSVGSNELQTGLLNSGNLDGWKWSSLKNYDGAFVVSGDTIFLFNGMPEIGICKSLAIYNKDMTTAEIEALP